MKKVYKDFFNAICGDVIGSGSTRTVFECKIRDDLVVKVENSESMSFANAHEWAFWRDHQFCDPVLEWLAPCEMISDNGRVLLQKRCYPIHGIEDLPVKLPSFITDLKSSNFGTLNDRVVCFDYAFTVPNPSLKLRKANYRE